MTQMVIARSVCTGTQGKRTLQNLMECLLELKRAIHSDNIIAMDEIPVSIWCLAMPPVSPKIRQTW
jgi:hypothetical protein